MTERNICDGKENVRDGKDILVYNIIIRITTTYINQKYEVEYNTFNRAQKNS